MTYKNILVLVDDTKANGGRLKAAIDLAREKDAHLTGLYVIGEPDLPTFVRGQIPRDIVEQQRADTEDAARAANNAFLAMADREGVRADARIARCQDHQVATLIARHARYADLVVAGQAEPDEPGPGGRNMVENLVLTAGRPVLVIPYIGAKRAIGRIVTVAWDAGREAARAVADGMPFLEAADQAFVLIVNPATGIDGHGDEPGADIALSLARHGVEAEVQTVTADDIDEGDAILSWLSDSGSDLLVMGLYGHSRVLELVLGGVSRRILQSMTVPVLLSR